MEADEKSFLSWIAKACDLDDAKACEIERIARGGMGDTSTSGAEAMATFSDQDTSALLAFHALWRPKEHPKLLEARQRCLSDEGGCSDVVSSLYGRDGEAARGALSPELLAGVQAICDKTLDCDAVLMMLDKYGFSPEALSPVRAHASKALIDACLEGACVCGDAASSLPLDDPRGADLARMGCENGEASGCYMLGRLYEEGRGVAKDEAFGRSLYEVACPPLRPSYDWRIGEYSPKACDRLAEIYEGGSMPPKDVGRTRYYAEFACRRPGFERDHAPCVRVARYWAAGAIKSSCVPDEFNSCTSNAEHAALRFYGPKYPPVDGKECLRPSVKALCDAHEPEIAAMAKPPSKKP